jgi:glycosyltransferase involved in cell wall biosynthesis
MSFRNQADLLAKAGRRYGWVTEQRNIGERAVFKSERWDLSIVLAPLWPIYVFDVARVGAPWLSKRFRLYGPVDGPLAHNLQMVSVLKNTIKERNIATTSQYCREALAESGLKDVAVVPHGLDPLDFVFPEDRLKAGFAKLREAYGDRVVFWCNINPLHRKGLTHLAEAMEFLNVKHVNDYVVVLHTDKAEAVKLAPKLQEISNLVIEDAYRHLNFRQIAFKTLTCDVVLFPSLLEGFGLPVLEALFAGKPVVMANARAHNELVGPDCAWIAPVVEVKTEFWKGSSCNAKLHLYNPEDLAVCMASAIENLEERKEKSVKAKMRSRNYHYLSVYKQFFKW